MEREKEVTEMMLEALVRNWRPPSTREIHPALSPVPEPIEFLTIEMLPSFAPMQNAMQDDCEVVLRIGVSSLRAQSLGLRFKS